jgi:short-subunit dehydrogenase
MPQLRNALVTGASSGIGNEMVRQLVQDRGMTVLASARRRDRLGSLAAECAPGRVQIAVGDLADPGFRQALWCQAEEMPGGVDLLINNAGLGNYSEFENQSAEAMRQIIEINIVALIDLTQMAVRYMKPRRTG